MGSLVSRSLKVSSVSSPPVPLGWFGVILIPMLFAETSVGGIAFIAVFHMTDAFVL